jgi:hypothetical protein
MSFLLELSAWGFFEVVRVLELLVLRDRNLEFTTPNTNLETTQTQILEKGYSERDSSQGSQG